MDVREAFRERAGADELEGSCATVDGVGVRRKWFGTDGGDQVALVAADRHRHHRLFRLEALAGLQRAVARERVDADIAVFGVRYVNESRGHRAASEDTERGGERRLPGLSGLHGDSSPGSSSREGYRLRWLIARCRRSGIPACRGRAAVASRQAGARGPGTSPFRALPKPPYHPPPPRRP